MNLRIDFETYSELDLEEVGTYKYAMHPSTRILMMGYKVPGSQTKIWEPGEPLPEEIFQATNIVAHNAVFEYLIWSTCGVTQGFPQKELDQFIDVMALCGKFGYPLSLEKAAKALECKSLKQESGKALIKKFGRPSPYNKQNSPTDWQAFREYCIDDVNTMDEVLSRLPYQKLSSRDQRLWVLTQKINMRGVPVNVEEAKAIYRYVTTYAEEHSKRLPELTDGLVTKATQVQRIRKWCESQGYPMPNGLGAMYIEEALEDPACPKHVAEVLQLRLEMGSSSANKFKTIINMEYNGRVHMNIIKNGATTGRYAGRGLQIHNLPRYCVETPGELIQKFMNAEEIDNPFKAAKGLVRAAIVAPEGYKLCVADWSAIETHLLFWLADDKETLELLRNREDLYKIMAAEVYNIPVEKVDKDEHRPLGKALILGCGYAMGYRRFKEAAKTFGVTVTLSEANLAVSKYRNKFKKVVETWYKLQGAAYTAMQNKDVRVPSLKVEYLYDGKYLWTILPSGRRLCYPDATFKEGDIQYKTVNSRTKQWTYQRLNLSQNIENIIQAIAADILETSVLAIDEELQHEHIGHVHDENITLVTDEHAENGALNELIEVMCRVPFWAEGLPLFAEGYIAQRFRK